MKLEDLNITNIKAFIEGTTKSLLDKYGPLWVQATDTVKEQVAYRSKVCKPCLDNGACIKCGCGTPGLFYATKGCRIGSYPIMLNEEHWELFKKNQKEGNDYLNRQYFQIWECLDCNSLNAHPYRSCHKCNKTYSEEEANQMIIDYQNKVRNGENNG